MARGKWSEKIIVLNAKTKPTFINSQVFASFHSILKTITY